MVLEAVSTEFRAQLTLARKLIRACQLLKFPSFSAGSGCQSQNDYNNHKLQCFVWALV